jgi:hypothetical protein
MKPACVAAMLLAERSASGLDDAGRIRLEAHLAECAACAKQTASFEGLARELRAADWSLRPRARSVLLDRALQAASRPKIAAVERRGLRVWLPLAAALASVFGAFVWLVAPAEPARVDSNPLAPRASAPSVARAAPAPSASTQDPAPCAEVSPGNRLDLGDAQVEVVQAARLCWRANVSTLELDTGAVRVDVERVAARTFRVVTKRFTVEVLGTAFEVDSDGVVVTRGSVRIVAPPDGKLVALLEAGQSWSLRPAKPAASAAFVPPAQRIALARRDLAAGRITVARARLRDLMLEPLDARHRAEAESLLAECSLAENDFDAAASSFGRVAREHGDSLAGETALFAKARAELRAGRRAASRETLKAYIARYPNGRFRKEALDHLRRLTEKP